MRGSIIVCARPAKCACGFCIVVGTSVGRSRNQAATSVRTMVPHYGVLYSENSAGHDLSAA